MADIVQAFRESVCTDLRARRGERCRESLRFAGIAGIYRIEKHRHFEWRRVEKG